MFVDFLRIHNYNPDMDNSMARANLNTIEVFLTNTIFKNWVFYEVNLVSQCLHLEILLLSKFRSERVDFS